MIPFQAPQEPPGRSQERSQERSQTLGVSVEPPTWDVGVEGIAKSFQAGQFNTQGLFKLAAVNTLVQ